MMNTKPLFSLCHTTARLPNGWEKAAQAWFHGADDPSQVEHILVTDSQFQDKPRPSGDPMFKNSRMYVNTKRRCAVDGWNLAAQKATGQILITLSDDWFPSKGWDTELLKRTEAAMDHGPHQFVIRVSTGGNHDILTFSILSRAYYERYGYIFHPEFLGMRADDWFTDQVRMDNVKVIDATDLFFEHKHPLYGTAPQDEVYEHQHRKEAFELGDQVYRKLRSDRGLHNLTVISEPTFEAWDYTNPDTQGIGGSETSHIEMSRRLQKRGHHVLSYAPTPFKMRTHEGVRWVHFSMDDALQPYNRPDVWIIYRAPHLIDRLPEDAVTWLICQDVDYVKENYAITPERARRFTRIVALCDTHAQYLRARYPGANVVQSSNGIKAELIEAIRNDPPQRNPRRVMYASSPDRGMEYLLRIFPRAHEVVRDLELHLYYGFDNINKVVDKVGPNHWITANTERLKRLIEQPGVTNHGRTGQPELLKEWFKAGIWCHPSNFSETSCITCMDAQACGAIPLTSPIWAVSENVQHGIFIDGNLNSELVRARYVNQLILLAHDKERQQQIREVMMPYAIERFNWENFVSQWECWILEDVQKTRRVEDPKQIEVAVA